ncbi:MAG: hypothetical protein RL596_1871, partial [Bacteroidota bacterium]
MKTIQFIYLTAFSKTGGIEKFNKNVKIKMLFHCLKTAKKTDLLFVGHINLAPLVCVMKLLNKRMKVIVFT